MLPSVAFFERCWSWRWRRRCSALTRFMETLAHKLRFREGTQSRKLKVVVRHPSRDAAASYAHAELCRIEHQEDDVLAGSADLGIEPSAWVEAHAGEARLISARKHGVLWLPSSGWEDMVDGE
ncbi:uncharacterized protein LOC124693072 [Lolium rigidum]|uniref:uncharacterized protein LOC124693072 n=1 Tax=Lolium rigidum TaxID=89674 RepID=UPI001F5E1365|nr:uncharacterized protein LOC124693072 [Lolium rigidum]